MNKAKKEVHRIFNGIVNQILIKIEENVNLSSREVKEAVNRRILQFHGLFRKEVMNNMKDGGWRHFDSDQNRLTGIKEAWNQAHIKFHDVLNVARDRFNWKILTSRFITNSTLNRAEKRLHEDMNRVPYTMINDPTFPSDVIQLKKHLDRNIHSVNQEYVRFIESVNQAHAEFKASVNEVIYPVWKIENQVPGVINETVNRIPVKIEEKSNLRSYEVKEAVVNRGIRQFHGPISEEPIDIKKYERWHFDSDKKRLTGIKEFWNQANIKVQDLLNVAQARRHANRLNTNKSVDQTGENWQDVVNSARYEIIKGPPSFPSNGAQLNERSDKNIQEVNQAHSEFKEPVNEISYPVGKRVNRVPDCVKNPINYLQTGKYPSRTCSNQMSHDLNEDKYVNPSLSEVQSTQYLNVHQLGSPSFYRLGNVNAESPNISSSREMVLYEDVRQTNGAPCSQINLVDEPTTYAGYKSESESRKRKPELVSNFAMMTTNNQPIDSGRTLMRRRNIKRKRGDRPSDGMRTTEHMSVPEESESMFRNTQLNYVSCVAHSPHSARTSNSSASSVSSQSKRKAEEESDGRRIEQIIHSWFSERDKRRSEAKDSIKCPICLDSAKVIEKENRNLVSTKCGHLFCDVCMQDQQRCPICRHEDIRPFHFVYL